MGCMPSPRPGQDPGAPGVARCCSSSPTNHGSAAAICSNLIRVSDRPLISSREGVDLLVALNQETVQLHQGDLAPAGLLIYDATKVKTCRRRV